MNDKYQVHADICDTIKHLYQVKNEDYGDSFGSARKEVPNYTLGKLYDKFKRYMNLTIKGESTARVSESLDDTLMDLANYAIMELTERRMDRLSMNEVQACTAVSSVPTHRSYHE